MTDDYTRIASNNPPTPEQVAEAIRRWGAAAKAAQDAAHPQVSEEDHRAAQKTLEEERKRTLTLAMEDPEGFQIFGEELITPVNDVLDYESPGRRFLRMTETALLREFAGAEATNIHCILTPEAPTTWDEMAWNELDRMQDTVRLRVGEQEANIVYQHLAHAVPADQVVHETDLVEGMLKAKTAIERHNLIATKCWMNRADLPTFIRNPALTSQLDPVTERALILAGYMFTWMNIVFQTSPGTGHVEVVPPGTMLFATDPEYVGVLNVPPLHTNCLIKDGKKAWQFSTTVRVKVTNPKGLALLHLGKPGRPATSAAAIESAA